MFRFKENARLMPCMEVWGETARITNIKRKNTQDKKSSIEEGKDLISKFLELEKQIDTEETKLFILKNKKNELLNKIMNNSELKKLFSEMTEKENVSKTK